jgi:hypothetical protein
VEERLFALRRLRLPQAHTADFDVREAAEQRAALLEVLLLQAREEIVEKHVSGNRGRGDVLQTDKKKNR